MYSTSIWAEWVHSPVMDEDDRFKNLTVRQLINESFKVSADVWPVWEAFPQRRKDFKPALEHGSYSFGHKALETPWTKATMNLT